MKYFYFFTDGDLLGDQLPDDEFGFVESDADFDCFSTTSFHKAALDCKAYAIADSFVAIQEAYLSDGTLDHEHINIILKPNKMQPLESNIRFPKIKYYIYRGIKKLEFFDGAQLGLSTTTDLHTKYYLSHENKGNTGVPPKEYTGIHLNNDYSNDFIDDADIENLFEYHYSGFNPTPINAGESIGLFDCEGFGLDIVLDRPAAQFKLSFARTKKGKLFAPTDISTLTNRFINRTYTDKALCFLDPCAFFGSFYYSALKLKNSNSTISILDNAQKIHNFIINKFQNKKKIYITIENENNYSFNYYSNYNDTIEVTTKHTNSVTSNSFARFGYTNGWPFLVISLNDFPLGTPSGRYGIELSLPFSSELINPLVYLAQGSFGSDTSLNSNISKQPKNAKKFIDIKRNTSNPGFCESFHVEVPAIVDFENNPAVLSCYIRLKYLKTNYSKFETSTSNVAQIRDHYIDYVFSPITFQLPYVIQSDSDNIRLRVYDEEIYIDLRERSQDGIDWVGSTGVAQDEFNVTFFSFLKTIHSGFSFRFPNRFSLESNRTGMKTHFLTDYVDKKYKRNSICFDKVIINNVEKHLPYWYDFSRDNRFEQFLEPSPSEFIAIILKNSNYTNLLTFIEDKINSNELLAIAPVSFKLKSLGKLKDDIEHSYYKFQLYVAGYWINNNEIEKREFPSNIELLSSNKSNCIHNFYLDNEADISPNSRVGYRCEWENSNIVNVPGEQFQDFNKIYLQQFAQFIKDVKIASSTHAPSNMIYDNVLKYFLANPVAAINGNVNDLILDSGGNLVIPPNLPKGILFETCHIMAMWLTRIQLQKFKTKISSLPHDNTLDSKFKELFDNSVNTPLLKSYGPFSYNLFQMLSKNKIDYRLKKITYTTDSLLSAFNNINEFDSQFDIFQDNLNRLIRHYFPNGNKDLLRKIIIDYQKETEIYLTFLTRCIFDKLGGELEYSEFKNAASGDGTQTKGILGSSSMSRMAFPYTIEDNSNSNRFDTLRKFTLFFNDVHSTKEKIVHFSIVGLDDEIKIQITPFRNNTELYNDKLNLKADGNSLFYEEGHSDIDKFPWVVDDKTVGVFNKSTQDLIIFDSEITSLKIYKIENSEDVGVSIYYFIPKSEDIFALTLENLFNDNQFVLNSNIHLSTIQPALKLIDYILSNEITSDSIDIQCLGNFIGRRKIPKKFDNTSYYYTGELVLHEGCIYRVTSDLLPGTIPTENFWEPQIFEAGSTYDSDSILVHENKIYRCNITVCQNSNYQPLMFVEDDWIQVAIFYSHSIYNLGDFVVVDDLLYECIFSHEGGNFNPNYFIRASEVEIDPLYKYDQTPPNNRCQAEKRFPPIINTLEEKDFSNRRYAYLKIIPKHNQLKIFVEAFASPLRARLDSLPLISNSPSKLELLMEHTFLKHYPNTVLYWTDDQVITNVDTYNLPSFNQLLTSLRTIGITMKFFEELKDLRKSLNNNLDDIIFDNKVDFIIDNLKTNTITVSSSNSQGDTEQLFVTKLFYEMLLEL